MVVKVDRYRSQTGTPRGGVSPGNPQNVGGADVGGALLQVAQVGVDILADRRRQQEEITAATGAAWAASFLGGGDSEYVRQRQQWVEESGDTGEGVVAKSAAWFDARIALAAEQAPDEASRKFALLKLQERRVAQDISAFEFEVGARKDWAKVEQDKGVESAASAAAADYASASSYAAEQVAAIRANPLFSPLEKREREVAAVESIAMAAAIGEAERNPYGMRRSILSSFGMGADTPTAEVVMQRDTAISMLEKIETDTGVSVPEELRAEAVTALMSGGGVSVDNATGAVKVTRGDQSGAVGGPWAINALSANQRAQLLSKVDTEIARREADERQRAEAGKVFIQQRVMDTTVALRSGEAVPLPAYAELVAGYGPERAALIYRELQLLQQNAPTIATMKGATNEELAAVISDEPTGTADRSVRQETYTLRATAAKEELAAREADPGGDTLRKSEVVREAYDAWQAVAAAPGADPQLAADAQARFVRTLFGEQRRRGIVAPKLPEVYVADVARTFDTQMREGDPEVAARSLEATARTMMGEPAALAQLSEKLSSAGRFAIDGVPGMTIRRLQEHANVTDAQRRDQLAAVGVTPSDVEEAVVDQFADFMATFSERPEGQSTRARYLDAAKIAAADALTTGRAATPEDAARVAYNELYGERNTVADGLRIPSDLPADRVTAGLRAYLSHAGTLTAVPVEPGLTEAETRAAQTRTLERNGRWVTNGEGDGAYLYMGGDFVKDAHGRVIEVKYRDAVLIEPERAPPARPRSSRGPDY
jgi:hypothetical protein